VKTCAFLFGIIFLIVGIAGFIPQITENGFLLKIIKVNFSFNVLHVLTGICALIVFFLNHSACQLYFQIVGILYAIHALLGFIYEREDILGIFASNIANTWMNVIIAIIALILGYGATEGNV